MFAWLKKSNRGESFVETMIAIFILMNGVAAAVGLIMSAMNIATVTKEKIIAVNLAREGIEAVRNIRDTNWLKYTTNLRECWNWNDNYAEECAIAPCSCTAAIGDENYNPTTQLIQPGFYAVDFDLTTYKWKLKHITNADVVPNTDGIWAERDSYVLGLDSDGLYTHSGNKSKYQRRIKIRYLNDADNGISGDITNRMEVASVVRFSQGKVKREVRLVTHLTDYWKRTGHGL